MVSAGPAPLILRVFCPPFKDNPFLLTVIDLNASARVRVPAAKGPRAKLTLLLIAGTPGRHFQLPTPLDAVTETAAPAPEKLINRLLDLLFSWCVKKVENSLILPLKASAAVIRSFVKRIEVLPLISPTVALVPVASLPEPSGFDLSAHVATPPEKSLFTVPSAAA